MPKVRHFECAKCKRRITAPDGKGMPARWTEIKIRETVGGGTSGFGRRMHSDAASALFCDVCYPRDWRVAYQRDLVLKARLLSLAGVSHG